MKSLPLGEIINPAEVKRAGGDEYPILSMTMHRGLIEQSRKFKKQVASKDQSDYKVVRRGQLVVGFPIDEGVLDFQNHYDAAIVSPAYGIWDLQNAEAVDCRYLARFLRSPRAMAYYKNKLRGSTARRRSLPKEVFLALDVPMPPLDEQRRIVAILDQADGVLGKRRSVLGELDVLAESVFLDMFGDPATWSSRWPMGRIGEMTEDVQYGTSAKAGGTGRWPIVRMGNVTDTGRLDLTDLKWIDLEEGDVAKYTLRRGDLLFNRTNSVEKVGKTCVVATDQPLAFAGYLVRVRFKPEYRPEFVNAYMTSQYGKALRRGMAKAAVNQANINATEMKSIPIALPPLELQLAFAQALQAIEAKRLRQAEALLMSEELRKSLQGRAFARKL